MNTTEQSGSFCLLLVTIAAIILCIVLASFYVRDQSGHTPPSRSPRMTTVGHDDHKFIVFSDGYLFDEKYITVLHHPGCPCLTETK